MRRNARNFLGLAVFASFGALVAVGLAEVAACSNSSAAASVGPNQPLGSPCDSTQTSPCAAAATSCSVNLCTDGVCSQFLVDGGSACAVAPGDGGNVVVPPINSLCTKSSDCDAGEQCGYLSSGGCGFPGVCVVAAPVATPAACGCNGQSDPYIANGFTGAPAASPGACDDAGPDAQDASDAGAWVDAADAADANDGASE